MSILLPSTSAAGTPDDADDRAARLEMLIAQLVAKQVSGRIGYWAAFSDERGVSHFAFTTDPAYADLSPENAARRTGAVAATNRAIERYRASVPSGEAAGTTVALATPRNAPPAPEILVRAPEHVWSAAPPEAPAGVPVCPFLGFRNDPSTRADFPDPRNLCHATSFDWVAHDDKGNQYQPSGYALDPQLSAGTLAKGRKAEGWVPFDVPAGTKALWADYAPAGGSVIFSVKVYPAK